MLFELIAITGIGLFFGKNYSNNQKNSLKKSLNQQTRVMPFMGDVRNQQLEEFTADGSSKVNQIEKLNDRNLMIAVFSMSCAAVGNLIYTPLVWLSLPGILYITQYPLAIGYNALIKQKKMTIDLMSSMTKILFVLNGYFFMASFVVFLFTINRKLLSKITDNSKKSLIDVFKQHPKVVWVIHDEVELEIPFDMLKLGDIVVVNAGSTIPVDGHIIKGIASVDQHLLTGESQPIEKGVGSKAFALTMVLSGKIYIQVEKTGEETTASQIAKMLNNTINTKTDIQFWSKEMSDKTVAPTFLLSGFILPFYGVDNAIAILNSHFRYRATIASAIGVLSYLNLASHQGILVKDGRTFELLKQVDTVVFDKTGTLTEEQPQVGCVYTDGDYTENEVLLYAAAAESKQTHPIAKAILQYAKEQQLELPIIDETAYQVGYGLTVIFNEQTIRVGSIRFFEQEHIDISQKIKEIQTLCHDQGHPVILIAVGNVTIGAIELQASLRPGLKNIIRQLRQRNIKSTCIISGDHEAPTKKLAQALEIDHYYAEMLPEQKANLIEQFQKEGKSVCYIGDGINDAIALKKADVSISLRGASTVATDAAQVILMDQQLEKIIHLFDLAETFDYKMKTTMAIIVIPSVISMGTVLFFPQLGLLGSFIFPQLGLTAGVINAMKPPVIKDYTDHTS